MNKRKPRTLSIKNPAAHSLAEKGSKNMDVALTEAVIRSIEAQLQEPVRLIDWKKVDAICGGIAALPVLDSRTDDEVLGYDEFGIPRQAKLLEAGIVLRARMGAQSLP